MATTTDIVPALAASPTNKAQISDPTAAKPKEKGAITSDFETFLRMLTTQMQNQDPLEPMKSDELSVQLATFSGVEQQVRTNELLTGLGAKFGAGGMAEFASWVGKDARSAGPAYFDGTTPVSVAAQRAADADRAEIVVFDSDGAEVSRLPVLVSGETVTWDGRNSSGGLLPSGLYSIKTESFADGKLLDSSPAETYSRVTEARVENGEVLMVLSGGAKVSAEKITALREALTLP